MTLRIAVTGATGFIGGAVVRAARAQGHQVFAYGRRNAELFWDITSGPLPDPPEVDAVVHAAAAVSDWGPPAPIRAVTVDGTRHVAASFPGARLVHLSSASVYDPLVPTVMAMEAAAPVSRYLNAYSAAKADAEAVLAGRENTIILRPHAVYGAGDTTLLPRVLGAIRGRSLVIVGDGQTRQSLTSIDNLVDATLLACGIEAIPGIYNIADREPVMLEDALCELLAQRSMAVTVRHLPMRPAWWLAGGLERLWTRLRKPEPPRLTRYAISHLAMERTLDLSAARRGLGYDPAPTSFAGTADW